MNELFDALAKLSEGIDDEFYEVPDFLKEVYDALGNTIESLENEQHD
jgi:hypothetical protein